MKVLHSERFYTRETNPVFEMTLLIICSGAFAQISSVLAQSVRTCCTDVSDPTASQLSANSQGVIGLKGLSLNTEAGAAQGSVISSDDQNIHLDSGKAVVLRVNAK